MACYMFYKNEVNWHSWLNTLFFIPVTDFDRFTDPILALGWTLSFEFWFYSLFALFIGLLGRKSIVVLPLCLVSMSIITCFFYHSHWFLPKFLFHPFTIEFSFGILIYKLANKLRMVSFIVSFMAVIFLGYLVLESAQKYYLHNDVLLNLKIGMDRTIIWGSFALSLVVMTISIDNIRLFTWPEWLVLTGDRSYSIYLIQVYSLSVFLWFSIHLGIDSNSPIYYIITFISTIIIGIAISNLVEFPLARYFKKVLEQSAVKMKLVQPAFNIKA